MGLARTPVKVAERQDRSRYSLPRLQLPLEAPQQPKSWNQWEVRSKNANTDLVNNRNRAVSDRTPVKIVLSGTWMLARTRATTASIS
jgi:hypothetical protein